MPAKPKTPDLLHLVLRHHWFDETDSGRKRIEYRNDTPRWRRLIFDRRHQLTRLRFARGYTKRTALYRITHIDIGPCPLPGWEGADRIRIHFIDLEAPPAFKGIGIEAGYRVRLGDATGEVIGFRNRYTAVVRFGLADRDIQMEAFL